ncbi:MAG: asparagine synthase (glutamine-hydrolyzing) [Symploca sp. SIO2D2]|nr:asparagine synthase (glutamine-hydrolyzing) [Symploca sp. SIO2D2]
MCGISGKLSWDNPPSQSLIQKMNDQLIHRGPDAEGIYVNGAIGLGHRRLSIIDLSEAGKQPMSDISGLFWLVFNGEIYNYQEIRSQLIALGANFRTKTDTEVILEAYKHWGIDCLQRFNGMFAIALWDQTQQSLFLARDRLGEKPIFYYPLLEGGVVFASELKALRQDPTVPEEINPKALSHYFSLGYTLTSESILEGVKKLEAGHYLIVKQGKPLREVLYWNLAHHFQQKQKFASEAEAIEALLCLLEDAVKLRMIADVPLGAFLSGGLDSSAIVATMSRLRSPQENHTFTIGFQEKSYSELPEANLVANFLQVSHHEQIVDADMATLLPQIVWHADEPFADTSMIPMYFLAKLAREQVTVCLSGDGADELFAGYPTHVADKLHYLTRWLPKCLINFVEQTANHWIPVSFNKVSFDYKLRQFLKGYAYEPTRAHYSWRTIFSDDEKKKLLPGLSYIIDESDPFEHFQKYQQDIADCHYLDQAMYIDIKTWLVDDILVKVDRSTMAHGLEARVPFLDHRLVEFAASLPVDLKMKGFQPKYLLKKSQSSYLPDKPINRAKVGFNSPISYWLTTSLKDFFNEVVKYNNKINNLFDFDYIQTIQKNHNAKLQDNSLQLLSILNFILWY